MNQNLSIKINFRGGIISPGDLYNILTAAGSAGVSKVSFGLRQQLFIHTIIEKWDLLKEELDKLQINYELNEDKYPNMVSSYPAAEIFIKTSWVSEGVYKDIFDSFDYRPRLKVNISDSNQSFTPLFTGNINWVAAPNNQNFWHLFIRFPKTNIICEWTQMVYTNDLARITRDVENLILTFPGQFYDNQHADGASLFKLINSKNYILKPADGPAVLHAFNLPYYEGINSYQDKYWLGIYRRDEYFDIDFMKALCALCLQTRVGQLCATPWKTIIVKSIEEKDRQQWNTLLARSRINMRHAANELNFQVEDDCAEGVQLKNYLVKSFHKDDTRTFGICIGIKIRAKSEIFSNILIKKKALLAFAGLKFFYVYDILCAKDFNPNERTGWVFSRNNTKLMLIEELRRAIFSYYKHQRNETQFFTANAFVKKPAAIVLQAPILIYQCCHCLSVYEESAGDPEKNLLPGTLFAQLPATYSCPLCEAPKEAFVAIDKNSLQLQSF